MRKIPLTQRKVALVGDDAYERVMQYKWWTHKNKGKFYAAGWINGRRVLLHNFLMDTPFGEMVDHVDGDGLNCQWNNMRLATRSQNNWNSRKRIDNTSGYKGVSFCKKNGKWKAYIFIDGSQKHIGFFDSAEEAAHAYDAMALELFSEFAWMNFPDD